MRTRNLILDRIGNVNLRDDGEKAQLEFIGTNDKSCTVTLTFEQLQLVEQKIINSAYAARFNRGLHSDTPKEFSPLPDVVLVDDLQLEFAPTGELNFRIGAHDGRSVHVVLTPDHSKMLRQILGGRGQEFQMG